MIKHGIHILWDTILWDIRFLIFPHVRSSQFQSVIRLGLGWCVPLVHESIESLGLFMSLFSITKIFATSSTQLAGRLKHLSFVSIDQEKIGFKTPTTWRTIILFCLLNCNDIWDDDVQVSKSFWPAKPAVQPGPAAEMEDVGPIADSSVEVTWADGPWK